MNMRYRIEKRVANTDHWGLIRFAESEEEARRIALTIEGGRSTGVRIYPHREPGDPSYGCDDPQIIVGS